MRRLTVTMLTISRIPLSLLFFGLAIGHPPGTAWGLLSIAIMNEVLDVADGAVARHWNVDSVTGAILDSGTDSIVRPLEFISLVYLGLFPIELLPAIVTRDAVIMLLRQFSEAQGFLGRLRTRRSGKLKGISQGACIIVLCALAIMMHASSGEPKRLLANFAIWQAAAFTIWSMGDYLLAYIFLVRSRNCS